MPDNGKTILFLSRFCYPVDTPSAQRVAKTGKYLKRNGWKPIVVSAGRSKNSGHNRFDPDLIHAIDCRVVSAPYRENSKWSILGIFDRTTKHLTPIIYPYRLYRTFVHLSMNIVKREKVDFVVASSPPYMTLKVANHIFDRFGIPWVADFRDIIDELDAKLKIITSFQLKQEFHVCRTAREIVTVSPPLANKLEKRHKKKVHVIYNGFDEDDFGQSPIHDYEYFRIIYAGLIYGERSAKLLFDALDILLKEKTEISKLRVIFYTESHMEVLNQLKNNKCKKHIQIHQRIPYSEIIQMEMNADVLLLLSHRNNEGIMTSKIFEYLGAKRPILSIPGDNSVTDDLLKTTKAGISSGNKYEIADIVKKWYSEWVSSGSVHFNINEFEANRYTRRNQSRRFEQVLRGIRNE